MLEAYAFLAAFIVQILAVSVLYPAWFIRYVRAQVRRLPAERLAQLYPGVDVDHAQARVLNQYRALNTGIAVLGLLLLAWLFSYMRRPDWDDGPVEGLVTVYSLVAQMLPIGVVAWRGVRFDKKHKRWLPEGKRKASLRRRGLFDFVSPFVVFLAGVSYFLFAAFVIYIQHHPFPGFAGPLINIGLMTLVYASQAIIVYAMLYGRNRNPLETQAGRLRTIGLAVKSSVYSCIVVVVYLSLSFSLGLLDLQRWEPFALSIFFVISVLLASMGLIAPPPAGKADGLGAGPVP
jgi:hypothetical protein